VAEFRLYGRVLVKRLLRPSESYDGWGVNQRPPLAGDTGCLIEILQASGVPDAYVVERSGPGGVTEWLCEFAADELEPLDEPANPR
jgi:hypothetical protein